MQDLDLITLGRASVDLYGGQVGGRLEDMASFSKYIGGSPTNIAAGAARLGLRSALITRVGDEHFGRFIREQLAREGVDVTGVLTDPERLTALAILGIRDKEQFPLIFYRENCADMALCESDIDPDFLARARAVCVTGTHLYNAGPRPAALKALGLARQNGARTALDIDYRPNLWGVAGHDAGESRYVEADHITRDLLDLVGHFDLIVGTEEEFHITGGSKDTETALRAVRARTDATLVCKRGPLGAVAFAGAIPETIEDGEAGEGFPIEVFNVLGAGDGFMAGLLKGWLSGQDWPASLRLANACGAFAVSRHGCTPAYPSEAELDFFLDRGIQTPALRRDAALEQIHWSTTRTGEWPDLRLFTFDLRPEFDRLPGATPERIERFKTLCVEAVAEVAGDRPGYGLLCDARTGQEALFRAVGRGLWIGRPAEWPDDRPLSFEPELGPDLGGLAEWPTEHVVKVRCYYHPDDMPELRALQEDCLIRLFHAARRNGLEVLLEIVSAPVGPIADDTAARVIDRVYEIGLYPDWWMIEAQATDAAWHQCSEAVSRADPHCRGILALGPGVAPAQMAEPFERAARHPLVKGFSADVTILSEVARAWMQDAITDADAVTHMAERYRLLCTIWDEARQSEEGEQE